MQVTGGQFKGRKVDTPKGVKPTLSKVRESVFNVLFSEFGDFKGLKFLDMFSGSAIMALEAVSRGFEAAGIEKDFNIAKAARKSLPMKIISADAMKIIPKLENFDVIYIDPPWEYNYESIVELAAQKLNKGGVLICEYDKKKKPTFEKFECENAPSNVKLFKEKTYGRCCLAFFKMNAWQFFLAANDN